MLELLHIRYLLLLDFYREHGFLDTFNELIHLNRKIIVLEKRLLDLQPSKITIDEQKYKFIKIDKTSFETRSFNYPLKSRYLITRRNLKRGFVAYAVIKNNYVVGDCWFALSDDSTGKIDHENINQFKIHTTFKDVYCFDMYLKSEDRGNNTANELLKYAFNDLKEEGYKKIWAYVVAKNFPSLWMTRLLGFKKSKIVTMHRFIFLKRVNEK
jgi:hypothetical protein